MDINSLCLRVSKVANEDKKHATDQILEQFKMNMETVPEVKWQYYGSVDGVLYGFPASKVNPKQCDTYDPRLR